ncbi:DUF72 domain-containing protein [Mucilaginibacter limnophilus]|uniref:DUF72 domain-containing protein n=1 Tax=Mucilaginibacter limnophilus TaxID=1932778 RepID=A0A3S2V7P2_9SPHI|nr:DUF72 domain-containing protein [Mucilaginibacter limnophilus]RVU00562.1 DUF72 domain-containing protein [Mucilaginibacter limnophilus]
MTNDNPSFYSGTSGLALPVPNKQFYPPQFKDKSRLEYYAYLFNSIEINSSFYKVPQAATIRKWAESVSSNFKFTFKLWKEITHVKELNFRTEDIDRFMQVLDAAGDKKGCLLIQFPPKLAYDRRLNVETLIQAVHEVDPGNSWKIAVEFRHRSWYRDETYEMLENYNCSMVLHDLPASAAPMVVTSSDVIYLRFHGPQGGYRGSYADDFLAEYASYITDWLAEGKTVYAYFNNTMGDAVHNLAALNNFVLSNLA